MKEYRDTVQNFCHFFELISSDEDHYGLSMTLILILVRMLSINMKVSDQDLLAALIEIVNDAKGVDLNRWN